MNNVRKLVRQIYNICQEGLSANCREIDHIDYICYRINGGLKSEENWFIEQAKPIN